MSSSPTPGFQDGDSYRWQRNSVFCVAMSHVIFCSGLSYGWAALSPLLRAEGFFSNMASQEVLSIVGTMGIAANSFCKLPLGIFLDSLGPRKTSMLGGIFLSTGALLMAFADRNSVGLVSLGYFLIGFAGPFVQTPCFQFAELFGERKGSATVVLIACFELSTGGFELFSVLHRNGVELNVMFVCLAIWGLIITATAFALWPDTPHRAPPGAIPACDVPHREKLKNASLSEQVRSKKFVFIMFFMMIHISRQGFLLVTVDRQSEVFFGKTAGCFLGQIFSVSLPLGFLPMMVFTACGLANRLLRLPDTAFIVASSLSILWALFLLIPSQSTYIMAFLVFPFARQLVFSSFFSYASATFGFRTFGRITGIISTLAGCVQLVLQNLLPLVAMDGWMGAPQLEAHRWMQIDVLICILPVGLLLWPWHRILRRWIRSQSEDLCGVYSPAEVLLK